MAKKKVEVRLNLNDVVEGKIKGDYGRVTLTDGTVWIKVDKHWTIDLDATKANFR